MRGVFVDTDNKTIQTRRISARTLAPRTPVAYISGIDVVVYPMAAGARSRGVAVLNNTYLHGQVLLIGVAEDGSDTDAPPLLQVRWVH